MKPHSKSVTTRRRKSVPGIGIPRKRPGPPLPPHGDVQSPLGITLGEPLDTYSTGGFSNAGQRQEKSRRAVPESTQDE
jgi:hypothetical protein